VSVHVVVDETKASGLLVAAARVQPRRLAPTRTPLRGLLLARQGRLHFTKEGKARQGQIAAACAAPGGRRPLRRPSRDRSAGRAASSA
jgi:hypothetical protein